MQISQYWEISWFQTELFNPLEVVVAEENRIILFREKGESSFKLEIEVYSFSKFFFIKIFLIK